MTPTFKIEDAGLDEQIQRTVELTRKEPWQITESAARIAVDACWRLTPPTATKHPMSESTKDSKAKGLLAVKSDITRVFTYPGEGGLDIIEPSLDGEGAAATRFWKLIREGNVSEAQGYLHSIGIHVTGIVAAPSSTHHQSQRNRRGRVRKHPDRQLVLNKEKIMDYVTFVQKRVGMARSGWAKAVTGLRARNFPAWATGQREAGVFTVSGPPDAPQITLGNTVPYIQRAGAELRVMQTAFDITKNKMEAQITVLLAKAAGTFERK